MAGSGKTSLVQRISQHIQASTAENYVINLDPAVHSLPYHANIDIRDTVWSSVQEFRVGAACQHHHANSISSAGQLQECDEGV